MLWIGGRVGRVEISWFIFEWKRGWIFGGKWVDMGWFLREKIGKVCVIYIFYVIGMKLFWNIFDLGKVFGGWVVRKLSGIRKVEGRMFVESREGICGN